MVYDYVSNNIIMYVKNGNIRKKMEILVKMYKILNYSEACPTLYFRIFINSDCNWLLLLCK